MGVIAPVQYAYRVTERKRLLFVRKGVGRNGTWREGYMGILMYRERGRLMVNCVLFSYP